jgi:hypothetical protein
MIHRVAAVDYVTGNDRCFFPILVLGRYPDPPLY